MAKINLGKVVPQKGVDYFTEEQKKEFIDESLGQIKGDIAHKLTQPESGIAVGKYFRVASIDDAGNPVLEAVNAELLMDGTTPFNSVSSNGFFVTNKTLTLYQAENSNIDKRNTRRVICPTNLDYAVRAGLISNSQITAADYPAIRQTLGIVTLTQEEYNLLTPNENTIYLIVGVS